MDNDRHAVAGDQALAARQQRPEDDVDAGLRISLPKLVTEMFW
jgi:hypothetical protein